jgi:hypothetical protein
MPAQQLEPYQDQIRRSNLRHYSPVPILQTQSEQLSRIIQGQRIVMFRGDMMSIQKTTDDFTSSIAWILSYMIYSFKNKLYLIHQPKMPTRGAFRLLKISRAKAKKKKNLHLTLQPENYYQLTKKLAFQLHERET